MVSRHKAALVCGLQKTFGRVRDICWDVTLPYCVISLVICSTSSFLPVLYHLPQRGNTGALYPETAELCDESTAFVAVILDTLEMMADLRFHNRT
jgi:hypothetical protein